MRSYEADYTDEEIRALIQRRAAILSKLQLISDAPAIRMREDGGRKSGKSGESRIPSGVALRDGAPPLHESAYAHFFYHFERAKKDPERTRRLIVAAEAFHWEYFHPRRLERSEERSRRIIRDYEGWREIDVAITEGVTVKHVLKLRAEAERDPSTGYRFAEAPRPVPAVGRSYADELAAAFAA